MLPTYADLVDAVADAQPSEIAQIHGTRRFTLNNAKQDPSLIRQCLGFALFAQAGVPAPRCNFAHVTVNGHDLGIYANVEEVRKPMLARHFADDDGNLYVLEHAGGPVFFGAPGRLLRIAPDGDATVILDGLDRPTSVAIGWDGEIYVTNHGITPGMGEVLRIDQ